MLIKEVYSVMSTKWFFFFFFFGQGFLKMSWDSYIDNLVAQTKDASGTAHADKACIIGIDGGAPWTSSGHACALQVILW